MQNVHSALSPYSTYVTWPVRGLDEQNKRAYWREDILYIFTFATALQKYSHPMYRFTFFKIFIFDSQGSKFYTFVLNITKPTSTFEKRRTSRPLPYDKQNKIQLHFPEKEKQT